MGCGDNKDTAKKDENKKPFTRGDQNQPSSVRGGSQEKKEEKAAEKKEEKAEEKKPS